MTQTIDLAKGQKSTQYQIENTTKETIPVTIKVFERIQNEDGTEVLPKTTQVKVFPPQLIVPPGQKKTIRVDWIADAPPSIEKAYRIVAEQVPLDLNKKSAKDKGGIKMLLKYVNALYVDPGKTKSNLQVLKYELGEKLRVYIINSGTAHQYLKNVKISFVSNKKTYSVSKKELQKLDGQNILAGSSRYFDFNFDTKIPKGLKGSIKFD